MRGAGVAADRRAGCRARPCRACRPPWRSVPATRGSSHGMQKWVMSAGCDARSPSRQRASAGGTILHVALVADPALLPAGSRTRMSSRAEVIDEVDGAAGVGEQLGDRLARRRPAGPRRRRRLAAPAGSRSWCARFSAATTSTGLRRRAHCSAVISAEVPARCEAVTSMRRCRSAAGSAPRRRCPRCSRSWNGKRGGGEAQRRRWRRGRGPVRQSRAASTAMVTESSSQLHMARSPLAWPLSAGLNQPLASAAALRCRRRRGM